MARRLRSSQLETRTNRLKLAIRKKPYAFTALSPGIALGYRRCQGAGRWVVRCADGHGSSWTKVIAIADDHEDADSKDVLDFWQACDKARKLARGSDGTDLNRPLTWGEGIDAWELDLKARGGRIGNATRLRSLVPPGLLAKPVTLLTGTELARWRDRLIERGLQPASVTRECKSAMASLNLVAGRDERITKRPWTLALKALPGSRKARPQVLTDDAVRTLVAASYQVSERFGLFCELLAITGARPVQVSRLLVEDLHESNGFVMMPRSVKGKGVKRIDRRRLPLPAPLLQKLKAAAGDRPAHAPLLLRDDGEPWQPVNSDVWRAFRDTLALTRLPKCTPYALRHSSIARMLLRGVPVRVVADHHDTSVAEIERTYGHLIADHAADIISAAQIDLEPTSPAPGKVVSLKARRS